MIDPNTTEQRIYRAQSLARIEEMNKQWYYLQEDVFRLESVLNDMKDRCSRLGAEIRQEKAQWKEDK